MMQTHFKLVLLLKTNRRGAEYVLSRLMAPTGKTDPAIRLANLEFIVVGVRHLLSKKFY